MMSQQTKAYRIGLLLLVLFVVVLAACSGQTEAAITEAAVVTAVESVNPVAAVEAVPVSYVEPVAAASVDDVAATIIDPARLDDTAVVDGNGNGNGNGNGTGTGTGGNGNGSGGGQIVPPSGDLDDTEAAALIFMREEEKLAHDVYVTLYETWGLAVFQNISASEQMHSDSILNLLNTYQLADPAAGNGVGVFTDPALQALYNQLVAQGTQTLSDALRVGAAIEEIDILDLDARLAQTDNADIIQVFQNLRSGSESHLRAFVTNLERQTGEIYVPQYLSQEMYDAIMAGTSGNGNGNGGSAGGGTGSSGGNGNSDGGYGGNGNGTSGTGSNGNGTSGTGSNGNGGGGNGYRGGRNTTP
ncbi:MAG: DUF2202 domain-containing protein [Chloroflexota bacterium]